MPTTLTGLLLFVVLLLPGFAYLVGKERVGTERRTSPLRETVSIVSASVTSELAVVAFSWWLWSRALDIDRLIGDPGAYWRERPGLLAAWGLGLLAASTAVAVAATRPSVRRPQWVRSLVRRVKRPHWLRRLLNRLVGPYPHPSSVSGWWTLFEHWKLGLTIQVGCALDDSSYVRGWLASFNTSADDTTERDLLLHEPIYYRAPGAKDGRYINCQAVCIPGSRITLLQVAYFTPDQAAALARERAQTDEQAGGAGQAVPLAGAGSTRPVAVHAPRARQAN